MKKCLFIHINDGKPEVLQNGNHLFVERFFKTEEVIEHYLAQGYEVKQIMPDVSPAEQGAGNYTFYKGGITVYFEKDESDGSALEDVILDCLNSAESFDESALTDHLESMAYSREAAEEILDAVDCYDIRALYQVLLSRYDDFLTHAERTALLEKYSATFAVPLF